MFLFVKYIFLTLYGLGLIFFGFYMNLCELGDIFSAHIYKENYVLNKTYDYIVVGAGSAGSVVALRLSEDPNVSVLLLEAGAYGGNLLDIPAIGPMIQKSVFDWQYKTEPQEHACKAFENNVSFWPMGKIFGGTGRLNLMMYTRGHRNDFDQWYENVPNYNYETDILEFFKKAENHIGSFASDTKYHSRNGPLTVANLNFVSEFYYAIINAAKYLGFPIRNINGEYNSGFSQPQANLKNGSRYSTGHHLLKNKRPNLTIKTLSVALKVLFKSNFEAHAVKFAHLGTNFTVGASKGIVLSAGVIGSPKLLMLSGVGPKQHLKDVGIKPKIDLPVGDNLQDHISTGFDLVTLNRSLSVNFYKLGSPISAYEYFFKSEGPLTSIGCEALAILNSNCLKFNQTYDSCESSSGQSPDLELLFLPIGLSSDYGIQFKKTVGVRESAWNSYFKNTIDKNPVSILPVVLHPKSRGTVRLKDRYVYSKPVINPKYLTHSYDVKMLLRGINLIKKLVSTGPMQALGAKLNEETFPGCETYAFDSRAYWECYVRHVTLTIYHPVGTCKMGHNDNADSVVNYDFKVIGSNKLYIADGSILPNLVSANTNAAVVMIAEKAASVIKYYKYLEENFCDIKEIFVRKLFC